MNQLSTLDIKFDDKIQRLFLLDYLLNSGETFRMSLHNSTFDSVWSMNIVKNSVLNEEMRIKSQDSSSQLEVLVAGSRGRNREQSRCNSRNKYKVLEC